MVMIAVDKCLRREKEARSMVVTMSEVESAKHMKERAWTESKSFVTPSEIAARKRRSLWADTPPNFLR